MEPEQNDEPTRKQKRSRQGKLDGRRLLGMKMRHAGETFRAIADALHISVSQAHDDYVIAMRAWATPVADDARETEAERLDALQVACWSKAIAGEHEAIGDVLKIMGRRSKLLGLDEPRKVDVTAFIEKAAQEAGVDPVEALRDAEEIVRRAGL